MRRRIRGEHLESSLQFCTVVAIARFPKRAQELMRMRLQKRGAYAYLDFALTEPSTTFTTKPPLLFAALT